MATDIILNDNEISLTGPKVSVQNSMEIKKSITIGSRIKRTFISTAGIVTNAIKASKMSAHNASITKLNIPPSVGDESVGGKIRIGVGRSATTLTDKLIETIKIRAGEVKCRSGSADTFRVAGTINARKFNITSDERLKHNVNVLSYSLDKIICLQGVSFNWKENELPGANPLIQKQTGFLAQDVEKVLPESVSKDGKGELSVDYISLIPLLVEGMKTQQENIQLQSEKIESKFQENQTLKQRIVEMEGKLEVLSKNLIN